MDETQAVKSLAALAQASRLAVFRALVVAGPAGITPTEMAEQLGLSASSLSFHLKELLHAELITQQRDGRRLIYRAHLSHMNGLLAFLTDNCCQGEPCLTVSPCHATTANQGVKMNDRIFNVLFLCTGNSARSIMAEACLNQLGTGRFKAFSAGSKPVGRVHPQTLQLLERNHYPTAGLRSKNWDEFATADAPVMDFVFTVCDQAAARSVRSGRASRSVHTGVWPIRSQPPAARLKWPRSLQTPSWS